MRILLIHAEKFWWKVTRPVRIPVRDELTEENREGSGENVLVAFTCIESIDEENIEEKCKKAVESIIEVSSRIGIKNIIVYPYAHLSNQLGDLNITIRALRMIILGLSEKGLNIKQSPFGYYKEFMLHCKGHPLAEALRVI
ncbi:MAG: threonyl-tRNA synthetase editing domain-containing protein [Candidatus Methanomethylicia archaeon]|nr:threonyl-tRNA synthetase editing domain-containing protein [Candidatus Methanomethylicia archaeon]MDW7988489.1 threonyl-tRNA synthetase editing domain-containing protein [Nitrososphaerota archaeon]